MRAIYKGGASILLCLSIGLSACAAPESRPQQAAPSASMDAPGKAYHTIDAQQAKAMLDGQPQTLLVDVRTQPEYAAGHIPGAICIPLDTIQSRPAQLPDL